GFALDGGGRLGPRHAGLSSESNAREEQVDLRAQRLERGLHQQVLLEAVAASALGHELSLEVLGHERHRHAALRIEVLERDRRAVASVQLREARTPTQPDPPEGCVEVEHRDDSIVGTRRILPRGTRRYPGGPGSVRAAWTSSGERTSFWKGSRKECDDR